MRSRNLVGIIFLDISIQQFRVVGESVAVEMLSVREVSGGGDSINVSGEIPCRAGLNGL